MKSVITPHQIGDGGILCMPMRANITEASRADWRMVTCPACGEECWETDQARRVMRQEPDLRALCTACALAMSE